MRWPALLVAVFFLPDSAIEPRYNTLNFYCVEESGVGTHVSQTCGFGKILHPLSKKTLFESPLLRLKQSLDAPHQYLTISLIFTEHLLCHSSDTIKHVAREIVSLLRDEPGGVTTCRVHLNVIMRGCRSTSGIAKDLEDRKEVPSIRLGGVMIGSDSVVATSEVDVYLFASLCMLARFQAIITSLSNKQDKCPKLRKLSLHPEFILEKQKLFRSNSSTPVVVLKTLSN